MKRSSWLFFALMLILQFNPGVLYAGTSLTNGVVELFTDADNNGYVNRGDTIRVSCIAVFTAPATAWQIAPYVDLSSIGMGTVALNDNGGGNFSANITLNNWNPAVNYVTRNVSIRAVANDLSAATQFANIVFDLCQVEGTNTNAVNSVTLTNRAILGQRFRVRITDNRYQTAPLGGTICTVNLTPIGGNAVTPMTPNTVTGVFEVLSDPIPAGIEYTGPLTLSLNDPMLGHPAVGYQTGIIIVDSVVPAVDFANTSVVIQSGNTTALPGDVLRITAAVTAFDNETVSVFCTDLPAAAANPPLNPAFPMPLITSNGIGNAATWQIDVTLSEANLKNTSLPFIFTFTDDDGNVTTVTRYIAIDLDQPNILSATSDIFQPNGANSTAIGVATMACRLQFNSNITIDVNPDTLSVTIDLSEIGASAVYPMNRVGLSDDYRANYILPQGNLEDVIDYEFIISARDAAGNLVARATAPPIRIDNKPPTLSNILLTSSNPNNSSIIRVGDQFTVECTVTDIESGSASVDLTRLGVPLPHTLLPVGGNVYRNTWTLPDAAASPAIPPVVDGFTAFTVYTNDTVNGGANVGHIVEGFTNQLMIDNEPPEIIDSAFDSDIVPVPTVFIIGNSVKFYARVTKAPITVTINMLHLNQGNAENMWPSTNPNYDPALDWYEYVLPGGIPEGLIDGAARSFRVTATDDAGNTDTEDIFIDIDNKPVKVTDFDVNVTYRNDPPDDTDISIINLNKEIEFTISLDSTTNVLDLGADPNTAATIDLSKFGGKTSTEALLYVVADHAFSLTTDDYTELEYDSSSHRFTVTITDKSGNKTTTQSAQRRVDNWPPVIVSTKASLPAGGTRAKIGDTILFEAEVSRNEGVAPEINLANLGLSSAQAMTLVSTTSGISLFQHSALVANGTRNDEVTDWTITARDNDLNFVASTTNTLLVDSLPPQISTGLNVTGMDDPSYIRLGESITFTVELDPLDTTIATVTVDMRAVGRGASETLTIVGSTAAVTLTTLLTTSEYPNHRFTATIADTAGNKVTSQSQTFTEVDCRPVILNDSGLVLWQDNGFINPGFAGPGDVVMVWASATYYQDAVLTANLATGTPEVDFASVTMTFNSTRSRHEGQITIATATSLPANWPVIAGNLTYRVRAVDDVNNISSTTYTACPDFVVRNTLPTTIAAGINLSPNYRLATTSSNILVYNLASSTTGDGLVASVTFADNLVVHKAWLDFREFGTGTVNLSTDVSSSAATVSGYTVNRLPAIEDGISRRVWLYAMDEAGNATYTSERMFIDNVAPTLVNAEFDGSIVTVGLSEIFDSDTFYYGNWQIIGSSSLGAPVNLTFTPPPVGNAYVPDLSSFQLELTNAQLRTMSEWASTPIYLKVTNDNATSAVTDMWGNELRPVDYYPITITDSAWREPARITHFTMNQTWPNTITLDLLFSKAMDVNSVSATAAVMLLATDTTGTFANNVDYNLGYVFQASSTNPLASDTFTWQSSTHLQITLSETGRRWVARKLTNDTNKKLYFACRHTQRPFVLDFLGKPVTHIAASSPLPGIDNRPVSGFAFRGPPNDPKLSIGDRTLILAATDLLLLSNGNYYNNDDVPYLIEPVPLYSNRVTGFHSNIILHESNSNSTQTLQLAPLDATSNPLFASSTVTLHLTDDDLVNILALYQANPNPVWEMTIKAGAFTNLWGTPNLAYLPSDYPGSMIVATGTPATGASIAAVSMSDKPTVSAKLAGELIFEVEVFPPDLDGIPLPLQGQATPAAGIFLQDAGNTWVASGTAISYSERTVDGKLRGVFRYQNTAALPTSLQGTPAVVNIYGVTDIFGNSVDLTASYAYDLNSKNDAAAEGFNDTASAAIVLDTQKPVVSSIIPNDFIGKIPAGSIFRVNFDEDMNSTIFPTLTLATSTQTMTFSFSNWSASTTAEFTCDADFTAALPNGIWYYQVSAGADIAGNVMTTTGATAYPVQIRTYAPEVANGDVVMRTVQNTISTAELINQPWSQYVGNAVFSVTYTTAPTQNLPHFLEIYDPTSNTLQGKLQLTISGNLATATFSAIAAGAIGPTDFAVRVIDSLNNRTDKLLDIVYDGLPPSLIKFDITGAGVGSSTAEYTYFNPASGDLMLDIESTTTDPLRLAVYNAGATSTQNINESGVAGSYFLATGSNYTDGSYTLTIVDLAGNIGTGSATRQVMADSIAPSLVSIVPQYAVGQPGPYTIGKCLASETKLVVTFSEPMDADPAQNPILSLTLGASTINWRFVQWIDTDVASTAVYENIGAITSALTSGIYTFTVTGGRDLAFNARTPASDQTQTINVYTTGPYVTITNYTNQSHIYGTTPQTNLGYNPIYTAPASSATIRIDFIGTMFDTYDLIVSSGTTEVGSYTGLPLTNPSIIPFEPINASWTWAAFHPQNASYTLQVRDSGGDYSPAFGFRYDTIAPTIDTTIVMAGPGIATDTEYGANVFYHSPAAGAATFTIATVNADVIKFLVYNGIATHTVDMVPGLFSHNALWSSLTNAAAINDGPYMITAVDTAGNLADGTASTSIIMIDTVAPELVDATAVINGLPSDSTGVVATSTGLFVLTFDSGMNSAIAPTLTLASDSGNITMVATGGINGWISSDTCQFTNTVAIDKTFAPGTYSYIVTGAQDYAGNTNATVVAGAFTVELFTEEPDLTTYQVVSNQLALYDALALVNRPLSFETYAAGPNIATLTISYRTSGGHPYQLPHLIRLYNSANTMVSETAVPGAVSGVSSFTLTAATLGTPGAATQSYSFRLVDSIGNISASYTIPITYDGIRPTVTAATITNVSNASVEPLYYNELLHGALNVSFTTSASTATDSLVLVIGGAATHTWDMSTNTTSGISTYSVSVASAAGIAEGDYLITAADMAGNFADGAASTTRLVIDRTAPVVVQATTTTVLGVPTGLPIVSSPAEATYFTVVFDNDMNELASATPTLVIATSTAQIACTFVDWIASDTARFVNTATISNSLPQGDYDCSVTAWDLAGNKLATSNAATMEVRSRGPIVTSFMTTSYQATTASATLASGDEMLTDQPFSFMVDPGIATISILLTQPPDGDANNIWLHFMQDNVSTFSTMLPLVGNAATFAWSISDGPLPALATTFTMRVADANGDLSLESYLWRIDNDEPIVQTVVATGGEMDASASLTLPDGALASDVVYFNPDRHRYISTRFNTAETETPRLRIRGANSTDTYYLNSAGTNQWSTNFEGRYSRNDKARMPDGDYALDMVDPAGNVALTASGAPLVFGIVIDTVAPDVATYTLTQNSLAVTSFAPTVGDLQIITTPTDPGLLLNKTGIWYVEVRNESGVRVNRLQIENLGGFFTASWDGTDTSGNLVLDGTYKLRATDYAGNPASLETEIFTRTTPFRVSAIEQVSSSSARIWFNHDINENSWLGLAFDPIIASPPLTISGLTRDQERSITFNVSPAFEHGISYIFAVATDSIRSVFGADIDANNRTVILLADGRGPVISGVSFHALAGQQEFRVEFDENYQPATAGEITNYTLTSASGSPSIVNAVTQSDLRSVILTASSGLIENVDYTIAANNIVDVYGNATASSFAFKGRDLTPPVLTVSAFSNPANENDIIVVVTSNELLKTAPTLAIAQSNAPIVTTMMQQGAEPKAYMMGVSLSSSYAGNGTLTAEAQDLAGNTGQGTNIFTVAYVSSARASIVQSADSVMTLNFNEQSLKADATVRILQHQLEKGEATGGAIRTSLQRQFRSAIGSLRGSLATDTVLPNHTELIPVSDAYEIGISKGKVNKGFSVNLASNEATSTVGLGLFNQSGDSWNFVTANRDKEGAFVARTGSSQMFAIMLDAVAPKITLSNDMNLIEPFRSARPEFKGHIEEAGSGLDMTSVKAYIDNGPAQTVQVAANGNFLFTPQADLVAGNHDLTIEATDKTGNLGQLASTRFSVTLPLSIGQIMQYPNPANRRAFIRISANRGDLTSDLVRVTIYDVAGHKVGNLYDVRSVRENWGINARYLYDIPWDLCNSKGKAVANGVYFARIEVRDPQDPSLKTKRNFKLAVLR